MGKVALVTGGGRGIGLGISKCLAAEGYDLVVAGVRAEDRVQEALGALRALGAGVLYCRADVSDPEARERVLDATRQRFGRLHLLVNNAGVALRASAWETQLRDFEWLMNINFWGVVHGCQAFLPALGRAERSSTSHSGVRSKPQKSATQSVALRWTWRRT